MNHFKATPEQWQATKERAANGSSTDIRLHDLLARVETLEAQGNPTKMVPPPVATDEELLAIWYRGYDLVQALRALYDLGVAHGQASSREVADPAAVEGVLARRIGYELSQIRRSIEGPAND